MGARRFVVASAAIFVVGLAWGALLHLVVLRGANAAIAGLLRTDLGDRMWLSILASAAFACLFVAGYRRVARNGSVREGIAYGLFFAAVAGLLVDVNQYVLYPIPGRLALTWFAGGVLEFALYGALASRLCPPAPATS